MKWRREEGGGGVGEDGKGGVGEEDVPPYLLACSLTSLLPHKVYY